MTALSPESVRGGFVVGGSTDRKRQTNTDAPPPDFDPFPLAVQALGVSFRSESRLSLGAPKPRSRELVSSGADKEDRKGVASIQKILLKNRAEKMLSS